MSTIKDVKQYWEDNPLLSYELEDLGSEKFFRELDRAKREDSDKFAIEYWEFERFKGKRVLDMGCGPGWLTVNYALGGAEVNSIDITSRAVDLTKKHLQQKHATANVNEENAENLQFEDNSFDLVVSSGVLHHTPDTFKAIKECFRVLRPGGKAKITLYRKGILHSRLLFTFTKSLMRFAKVKHPGADIAKEAKDVDDFIRQYDGAENPVGIGKKDKEWSELLRKAGFEINKHEIHFFPKRFLPFNKLIPGFVHYFLDRYFGTMIYFELRKI